MASEIEDKSGEIKSWEYFKKEGVDNQVKCYWEVKPDKDREILIWAGNMENTLLSMISMELRGGVESLIVED